MTARKSDSRRRRLLKRGLMGDYSPPVTDEVVADAVDLNTIDPSTTVPTTADLNSTDLDHSDVEADFEAPDQAIAEGPLTFATPESTEFVPAHPRSQRVAPAIAEPSRFQEREVRDRAHHSREIRNASQVDAHAGLSTIQSLLAAKQPLTWVFTGDNTVQGAFYSQGQRGFVEIFAERLRAELRRSMDVVINTGISGDTVSHALATLHWRVSRFKPDIVAISLGLNDAKGGIKGVGRFQRQMRDLLDEIRTQGAIPLIILPHPVAASAQVNREYLADYVESIQAVTLRDEVPMVDHWNFWLKNWPTAAETRKRLQDGRLHLNPESHRELAVLLFETLGIYDPSSQACQTSQREKVKATRYR